MSDEQAFLDTLKANPADDTTRLVYADWLDERGETAKAEYLRLVVEAARAGPLLKPELEPAQALCRMEADLPSVWCDITGRRFDLVLCEVQPGRKIPVIKVVREVYGIGLAAAKMIVETPPAALDSFARVSAVLAARLYFDQTDRGALLIQPSEGERTITPRLFFPIIEPWPTALAGLPECGTRLSEAVQSVLGPKVATADLRSRINNQRVLLRTAVPVQTLHALVRALAGRPGAPPNYRFYVNADAAPRHSRYSPWN